MFEKLRQSLDDLLARATRPEDRRAVVSQMKDALVHARIGLDDVRAAVRETTKRLEAERRELETIARRRSLAQGINDTETVAIAERFERQHTEKIAVLDAKRQAQEAELALVEREVESMGQDLKRAMSGVPGGAVGGGATGTPGGASGGGGAGADADDPLADMAGGAGGGRDAADPLGEDASGLESEIRAAARAGRRQRQEQEADARLAELKRRMGK